MHASVPMKYDPRVLVTNWHEARLQHPLDYDYSKPENLDLQRSSYHNFWFGDKNEPLPKSTAHEMMDEALDWHGIKKVTRHPYLDKIMDRGFRQDYSSLPYTVEGRPFDNAPFYYRKPTSTVGTQTPDRSWWSDRGKTYFPQERDSHSYNYIGYPKWHQQDYVVYPCYEPWSSANHTDPILKARKPERFLL